MSWTTKDVRVAVENALGLQFRIYADLEFWLSSKPAFTHQLMFWKKKKKPTGNSDASADASPGWWPLFGTGTDAGDSPSADPGTPAEPHHGGHHHGAADHSSGHPGDGGGSSHSSCSAHSCGGHSCGGGH
jgi:hypothetical protein